MLTSSKREINFTAFSSHVRSFYCDESHHAPPAHIRYARSHVRPDIMDTTVIVVCITFSVDKNTTSSVAKKKPK